MNITYSGHITWKGCETFLSGVNAKFNMDCFFYQLPSDLVSKKIFHRLDPISLLRLSRTNKHFSQMALDLVSQLFMKQSNDKQVWDIENFMIVIKGPIVLIDLYLKG